MERLDTALADVSPRLTVTATTSQFQALIAMTEAQNFTLAARALDLAQPSVGNFWQADLEEMPWLRSRT
jgi:hypothetical protein